MFGRKKNRVHSTCSPPLKRTLQPDQQLSLMLQQVSSQLNLMLSLQHQHQQQYINNLTSTYGTCNVNELDRQGQYTYSHHQRQCPYHNDVLSQPPILSYSQPNFCEGSRGPYAPSNSQQNCQQCPLSPSASSFLSTTQHPYSSTCPHDICHQSKYPQQYHSYDPYLQYSIPTICHNSQHHPPVTQQYYPTRVNSISGRTDGATSFYSVTGPFNKQQNYSDPPLVNQSKSTTAYTRASMRTKSRSRTDPLPPVPSFGNNSFGNHIGNQDPPPSDSSFNMDLQPPPSPSLPPISPPSAAAATENLLMPDHQPELSWTDIYRQNLRSRPDALASPPGSSFNAMQTNIISATHTRFKSSHSRLRGWWRHGKYKWKKLREMTTRNALL